MLHVAPGHFLCLISQETGWGNARFAKSDLMGQKGMQACKEAEEGQPGVVVGDGVGLGGAPAEGAQIHIFSKAPCWQQGLYTNFDVRLTWIQIQVPLLLATGLWAI